MTSIYHSLKTLLLHSFQNYQRYDLCIRAPQLENDFDGNGDGGNSGQNDPLRLGPMSFGSKLMDHDGLKVSHFQLKI